MEQISLNTERKLEISLDENPKSNLKTYGETKEISNLKKDRTSQIKYIEREVW